ncbi:UbiA family prenyltransferase [Massilia sp. BJB1822]|uniref:UbiA family prenyltransferase n=1 Tax=Massilia sp. BJB1822 TaxID=2744470 RepID=UPI001593A4C3|nr:UbiA family prenyltransferase [Massilia sp. BJB1822]NVD98226.1 UbiA family prenyltransferase [Massilia sp. BJB1822]
MAHTSPGSQDAGLASAPALLVELDGMLISSSLLWEALLLFVKRHLLRSWLLPLWLCQGRQTLDRKLAAAVQINPATLPYDQQLLQFLGEQRAQGRRILLGAASQQEAAEQVASHLQLFDRTVQPSSTSGQDRWHAAADTVCERLDASRHGAMRTGWHRPLLCAMRPRQWLKNLLVFVPMLAGHALHLNTLAQSAVAFLAFSLCASSAYLLNDALDAQDDRLHPSKRHRPIAAGTLPLPVALAASALLAPAGLLLSAWLDPWLLLAMAVYFVCTLAYSLHLKRLLMVDIVTLALLYSLRILGGSAATHIEPSYWLLGFSFFLFLSLALLKRHSELFNLHRQGKDKTRGRGYTTADRAPLGIMGINCAFLSVLVFMLYFSSTTVQVLYPHPAFLMGIVPLLAFWLGRLWTLSFRGEVNEDPLLYVSRDRVSLVVIAGCILLAGLASH